MGPVNEMVADALDVLRAAGWTVRVQDFDGVYVDEEAPRWMKYRTVARSPWREVDPNEGQDWDYGNER